MATHSFPDRVPEPTFERNPKLQTENSVSKWYLFKVLLVKNSRAYALENYATVEIHPNGPLRKLGFSSACSKGHVCRL